MVSQTPPPEALGVLTALESVCGGNLVAAYLFGSAVDGGLREDSDVDVLAVVAESLSDFDRRELLAWIGTLSGAAAGARPVELTIVRQADVAELQYPATREFIFGEWLRLRYKSGWVPGRESDPDLTIMLAKCRQRNLALKGPSARKVLGEVPADAVEKAIHESVPALLASLRGDERNVLLTLARMWMTLETRLIVSKNAAAAWAMDRLPDSLSPTLDLARRGYLDEVADEWDRRAEEAKELAHHLAGEIRLLRGLGNGVILGWHRRN